MKLKLSTLFSGEGGAAHNFLGIEMLCNIIIFVSNFGGLWFPQAPTRFLHVTDVVFCLLWLLLTLLIDHMRGLTLFFSEKEFWTGAGYWPIASRYSCHLWFIVASSRLANLPFSFFVLWRMACHSALNIPHFVISWKTGPK